MDNLIERGLPCPLCKSSDARAEYQGNFYCFSCQRSTKKQGKPSKWAYSRYGLTDVPGELPLPHDYTTELTSKEKSYLYRLHFTDGLIEKYKIGHSDLTVTPVRNDGLSGNAGILRSTGERLILPYYEGEKLKYYEGKRLVESRSPKYITVGGKKDLFYSMGCTFKTLVIVEDILSAMRVGEVCSAVALRGTKLSDAQLVELSTYCNDFIVWLDSDNPGQTAARKIVKRLGWLGHVRNVVSEKDPKCYSDKDIYNLIKEEKNERNSD